MTAPNIEELITYLRGFFIDEKVTAVKANQIADALQSQAVRISALETWCIASTTQRLPEGLATQLDMSIAAITKEVLG